MKKINVCIYGKIKSSELISLTNYYSKLVSKYAEIEVKELKDVGERQIDVKDLPTGEFLVILTEHGQTMPTEKFSTWLNNLQVNYQEITFMVGNAYGFTPQALVKANFQLSLSPLTLAHELSLVVLLEQMYRGLNLHSGGKYHK